MRRGTEGGWRRWTCATLLTVLLVPTLTGCSVGDSDEEVVTERENPALVTPSALVEVPPSTEEATIHIAAGPFGEELLILQEDEPTVLHVVNGDETAYRLWIGEALLTTTAIPAAAVTDVGFTTPNAAEYEGSLLAAEDDTVLDTVVVRVQSAGAVQP